MISRRSLPAANRDMKPKIALALADVIALASFAAGAFYGRQHPKEKSTLPPKITATHHAASVELVDPSRQTATETQLETALQATRSGGDFAQLYEVISTLHSN